MKYFFGLITLIVLTATSALAQNVGIGISNPAARLHVTDSNVIFSTVNDVTGNGYLALSGAGTRLMWIPFSGAFRVGTVEGNQWDKDSIGIFSNAIGYNSKATGGFSFAAGMENVARGTYAIALGRNTLAGGQSSFSTGYQAKALGEGSFAAGYSTNSIGLYSAALGNSTRTLGDNALSLGLGTVAKAKNSLVLGQFNDTLSAPTGLLVIGNGTSATNRSNLLTVDVNGNTDVTGFVRMGKASDGSPGIKMKKIFVPIGPIENATMNIPLNNGITDSKVLAVSALLTYPGGTSKIPPGYTDAPGYEYHIQVQYNGITILNKNGNSFNIGARPITLLVTYEE